MITALGRLFRPEEEPKKRLEKYFSSTQGKGNSEKEKKKSHAKKKSKKRLDFLLFTLLSFILAFLMVIMLTGNIAISVVLGGIGAFFPAWAEKYQQDKRNRLFNSQLTDALTLASNSLKAGYSFLQAMDVVSREMPYPIGEEFARAIKEANLGVPIEDALLQVTKRVRSDDLDLVMTAVLIQRQVGGNLATILDNITETIRERVKIHGQIKTLTAQGKISGLIIICLPAALGLYLYTTNPKYITTLFTHPLGLLMVGMGILSQLIGAFLIYKIVNIEV